jgi:hypothetical protein
MARFTRLKCMEFKPDWREVRPDKTLTNQRLEKTDDDFYQKKAALRPPEL